MFEMTPQRYFQAIPLYSKADEGAFEYFKNNRAEINAITKGELVVAVPESLVAGDAGDLYSNAPGSKRYSGLKITDLPCLWIEDSSGHEIVPLPASKADINKLMVQLTEAARIAANVSELVGTARPRLAKISLEESRHFRNIAAGAFVAFLVLIGIFLWSLPLLRSFGSQVLTVSCDGFLGTLLAIVLFGVMRSHGAVRSADDGAIGSKRVGAAWEFGGPAALAVFVLLAGLGYETLRGQSAFNVVVDLYSDGSPPAPLRVNGSVFVHTRAGISSNITDGRFWLNELDSGLKGESFVCDVRVDGYRQVESQIHLTDSGVLQMHIHAIEKVTTTQSSLAAEKITRMEAALQSLNSNREASATQFSKITIELQQLNTELSRLNAQLAESASRVIAFDQQIDRLAVSERAADEARGGMFKSQADAHFKVWQTACAALNAAQAEKNAYTTANAKNAEAQKSVESRISQDLSDQDTLRSNISVLDKQIRDLAEEIRAAQQGQ